MKREFLESLGIDDKDIIDKIMAEYGKGIEVLKADNQDLKADNEGKAKQLSEISEKLKTLEGVDVDKFNAEIATLQTDIETQRNEYESKLASRDFNYNLEAAAREVKAKNIKAALALVPDDAIEKLKVSNNQKEEMLAVLQSIKDDEDNAFLFDVPNNEEKTGAKVNTGQPHEGFSKEGADPFLAGAMRGAGLTDGKEE